MSRLVERFWRGELGWRGRVLAAALAPAELAFRTAVRVRNAAYARGLRAQTIVHMDVPVISVGSLLVGGAGKTPFARWIVEYYMSRGVQPGLLHGGYARDEPELHRMWNPDVPVEARPDRVEGANAAIRAGARVLVLDDGFQHRRLARNLDIVLVPVESWSAHPHLLPVGSWREAPRALQRAHLIVLVHRGASSVEVARVRADVAVQALRPPIIAAALLPRRWRSWRTGVYEVPANGVAVTAIANPEVFLADIGRTGGTYDNAVLFRDHHDYTGEDVDRIRVAAHGRTVLTTEKDAVKLKAIDTNLDLFVLEQEILFDDPEGVLARMLDEVVAK
jgi:tetraacyldisaccharide 4'-kinase